MKLIIRESDLRNPFGVLAALARRCETTNYDATEGWHVLMAAIKYLQKQGVEADAFRHGCPGGLIITVLNEQPATDADIVIPASDGPDTVVRAPHMTSHDSKS